MLQGIFWRCTWVGAVLVRFVSLDQSLWLDEATTAQVVDKLSLAQILTVYAPYDFHPPLYYLFINGWTEVLGVSEYALRMPSVLFSLATGYLIYRIVLSVRHAQKVSGTKPLSDARFAAALFLYNPLILYYSQEARMYMMAVFLAVALVFACWPILVGSSLHRRQILWTNVLTGLLFATFYASAFFIASLHLLFIIKRKWRNLLAIAPGGLLSIAVLLPLLLTQLRYSQVALQSVTHWSLVLGQAEFKNVILLPLKFAAGRYDLNTSADMVVVGLWAGVMYGALAYGVWRLRRDAGRNTIWSVLFLAFSPIVIGYIVSFYKPMMQYFRFLYVVPFVLLACALVIRHQAIQTLLVVGSAVWCLVYVFIPSNHREDWQSLAASLPQNTTVYMVPSSSDPLSYYRPDITIAPVHTLADAPDERQIVVPYTFAIHGVDMEMLLQQSGKRISRQVVFRGVEYVEVR